MLKKSIVHLCLEVFSKMHFGKYPLEIGSGLFPEVAFHTWRAWQEIVRIRCIHANSRVTSGAFWGARVERAGGSTRPQFPLFVQSSTSPLARRGSPADGHDRQFAFPHTQDFEKMSRRQCTSESVWAFKSNNPVCWQVHAPRNLWTNWFD